MRVINVYRYGTFSSQACNCICQWYRCNILRYVWNSVWPFAVHLRVRQTDFLVPKTLYPTTSCTTFWQVEEETSCMNGKNSTTNLHQPKYFIPLHQHGNKLFQQCYNICNMIHEFTHNGLSNTKLRHYSSDTICTLHYSTCIMILQGSIFAGEVI